ncbi:hypothetical protein PV325_004911 [Microctonus aethiopoides]|nr:hypothetical protein PV325_004911 [Microctonus aethiopoides]KAK0099001.1 hypothetical protein PV326_010977 [Microctonus aethiopoides]
MPQCAVATCRNSHRRTRGRRIRYHRFPQIPEVRARWVRACGRAPLSNGDIPFNIQTARICSLHFTNDSYEKDMEHLVLGLPVRSRLRRGAVPTIGVPVNVQPITKMLVDDAKRSILKVAHGNKLIDSGGKILDIDINEQNYYKNKRRNQQRLIGQKNIDDNDDDDNIGGGENDNNDIFDYNDDDMRNNIEQKMTGIDILLALGLKPASR